MYKTIYKLICSSRHIVVVVITGKWMHTTVEYNITDCMSSKYMDSYYECTQKPNHLLSA